MAEINFPDPAASPYNDPVSGLTWVHNGVGWAASNNQNLRYNVNNKAADFTPNRDTDGMNPLYWLEQENITVTIDPGTTSGFLDGEVVTLHAYTGTCNVVAGAGMTLYTPDFKTASGYGTYSVVAIVYVTREVAVIYGDLEDG